MCVHCQYLWHKNHPSMHVKQYLRQVLSTAYQELADNPMMAEAAKIDAHRKEVVASLTLMKHKICEEIDTVISKQELYFSRLRARVARIYGVQSEV